MSDRCPKCHRVMSPGGELRPSKDHILPRERKGWDFIHGDTRNTIIVCQDCNGFRAACGHCWAMVACVDAVARSAHRSRWRLLASWLKLSRATSAPARVQHAAKADIRAGIIASAARKYVAFNALAARDDYIFPADTPAKQVWNLAVLAKGGYREPVEKETPMKKCPREPNKSCTYCPARPGEECPLDDRPAWMDEQPITAGTTGVCNVGDDECQSCQ